MHDGYKGGGRVPCGAIGVSGLIILLPDPLAERHKDAAPPIRAMPWLVDLIAVPIAGRSVAILSSEA